jgi:ATP-dependent RNA helicase DDX42
LIATDVASRGLDVTDVMTVINFDPAKSYDSHVHRCGRAGRLSKTLNEQKQGVAYTLLTDQDADFGLTLLESFEREGRGEITKELIDLSMKSKRYGGSRPKHSRQGLGFQESENKRSRWGS